MTEAGQTSRPPSDTCFQDLMADLGAARARYDLAVREVSVTDQPNEKFDVSREQYERWRDASAALRQADDAVLAFLARAAG